MDFSRTYDLEMSHQLTLGYRDADGSYFAYLVTIAPEPETVWTYAPPTQYLQKELESRPLEVMLALVQAAVRQELDGKQLVLPEEEYLRLEQAPSIQPVATLGETIADVDYATALAAHQASALTRNDQHTALRILRQGISNLETINQRERNNEAYRLSRDYEALRSSALAGIAIELVCDVAPLSQLLPPMFIEETLNSSHGALWNINELIQPDHLATINNYVEQLCGTALLDFPSAIASGDNPIDTIEAMTAPADNPNLEDPQVPEGIMRFFRVVEDLALAWQAQTGTVDDLDPLDQAQERADALAELEYCVFELKRLRDIEQGTIDDDHPQRSLEERRSTLLAQTAAGLASNAYAIAAALSPSTFTTMANSDGIEVWDLDTLLGEQELRLVDDYCEALCRTRLTDFPIAVQRGFNPTNGVPFAYYPHPERYDPTALFPSPETETLYEGCGLTAEEAANVVRIQRQDLRDRTAEEWAYLEQLPDLISQRRHDPERD